MHCKAADRDTTNIMLEIKCRPIVDSQIQVPGSKSLTHRTFIAAALSDGCCTIENALVADDTQLTLQALNQMGAQFEQRDDQFQIHGLNGRLQAINQTIYLGNSGTSMRLLTAVAALNAGTLTLTGSERMAQRPIQDLLDALQQLGIQAHSLADNGCPPVTITGAPITAGKVKINCRTSSQFLSGLLLMAPFSLHGIEIEVVQGPVSRPYVDMTVAILKQFGVAVARDGYQKFAVPGSQVFRHGDYRVEPDCSQAGYFWAAAAIAGVTIKVTGVSKDSVQGDVRLVNLLAKMGCTVNETPDGIAVTGNPLSAIEADMADMPDMVPTLAVVAAFAEGTTVIRNVAHLKVKESDRLSAVTTELGKMGIEAKTAKDALVITGGKPHAATIDTYDDHRIAMSFALAGLKVPGICIRDEHCVRKSFPNFWEVFDSLYGDD